MLKDGQNCYYNDGVDEIPLKIWSHFSTIRYIFEGPTIVSGALPHRYRIYDTLNRRGGWGRMHRDADPPNWKFICVNCQCGVPALRCFYLIPKRPADDLTDRHKTTKGPRTTRRMDERTAILYCHSGYLNPWPEAACVACNYGTH